jgi:hypothetical protein
MIKKKIVPQKRFNGTFFIIPPYKTYEWNYKLFSKQSNILELNC